VTATISRLHGDTAEANSSEVVAVILADGTVAETSARAREVVPLRWPSRLASGSISGSDWVLWWERRSFPGSGPGA